MTKQPKIFNIIYALLLNANPEIRAKTLENAAKSIRPPQKPEVLQRFTEMAKSAKGKKKNISPEQRERSRQSMLKIRANPLLMEKQKTNAKNATRPPMKQSTKDKIGDANKGRIMSEQARENMRIAQLNVSDEVKTQRTKTLMEARNNPVIMEKQKTNHSESIKRQKQIQEIIKTAGGVGCQ